MSSDHVYWAFGRVHSAPCWCSSRPGADLTPRHRSDPRCRRRGTPSHFSLTSPSTSPRRGCAHRRRPRSGPPAETHPRCSRRVRAVPGHRRRPARRRMPHRRGVRRRPRRRGPRAPQHRPPHPQVDRANRRLPPPQLHRPRQQRPAPRQLPRLHRLRLRHLPEARRRVPTQAPTGASRSPRSREMGTARLRSRRARASPASTWTSPMPT